MTKLLILLGIVLVVAGGTLTAMSDSGDADNSARPSTTETREGPAVEAEPTPAPTEAPVTNRQDCNAIRGQDYLSQEERTWFLSNCIGR